MSCSLNSFKGSIQGIIYGSIIGVIKGDTGSLDYSSYRLKSHRPQEIPPLVARHREIFV